MRLKLWKTKPILRLRSTESAYESSVGDIDAVEQIAPRRADVEAADDVHQRALAASRRAHDGDVLAGRDVEAETPERVHGGVAGAVDLRQVAQHDDGRSDHLASASATETAAEPATQTAAGRSAATARESVVRPGGSGSRDHDLVTGVEAVGDLDRAVAAQSDR